MQVHLLYFKGGCQSLTVTPDNRGIFEFNMTLLNNTIPYTMRIEANKTGFDPIIFDFFVGGYPLAEK